MFHFSVGKMNYICKLMKLKYLFGEKDMACEDSYLSFVTPNGVSDIIVQQAQEHFDLGDKIIWDLFAGIGTDSIKFAELSQKVHCTELNPQTYQHLCENTKQYDNITTYKGSCVDYIDRLKPHIIYYDPPWGPTYKSGGAFDFNDVLIGTDTVPQLALKLLKGAHLIIKAPITSNSFEEILGPDIDVFTFTQQKLKFIFATSRN
jgi:hypothetical protein